MEVVTEMLRRWGEEYTYSDLNLTEYEERYNALAERYESIKKELEVIEKKTLEKSAKHESILAFIKELEKKDSLLEKFDEELWGATINTITIKANNEVIFEFKDGTKLPCTLK